MILMNKTSMFHELWLNTVGMYRLPVLINQTCCAEHVLRTHRNVARGLFGVRPTATSEPLVGPPSPPKVEATKWREATILNGRSPVTFSDKCFHPPPSVADIVSSGQEDEEDSMSISAMEKEGWAESERDQITTCTTNTFFFTHKKTHYCN